MEAVRFAELYVENWRQFDYVTVPIHPRLTVITGANGAGKTTLLGFLTQHFGWSRPLLATPWRDKNGAITYITGSIKGILGWIKRKEQSQAHTRIGRIKYSDGTQAIIGAPTTSDVQYSVQIADQKTVQGLYIPSHRVLSQYQQIGSIPTQGITAAQAYGNYLGELYSRWNGIPSGSSPLFRMKEALISMATFGEGNTYVDGKPELLQAYLGFIEVLKKVLPETLGFETLAIRTPDVVLVTSSGEFLLDAVSGGVSALIDLAWQIYTFSYESKAFTVIIDEPENHLHPSMQRALLPRLIEAFPLVQFVVATHSPFIVTSVRDSSVVVLSYREGEQDGVDRGIAPRRSIHSMQLDQINMAGSANNILRDVLGLESTVPLWASRELQGIVGRYRNQPFNGEQVDQLSKELDALGLGVELPAAINAIFEKGAR
ncbi:ATP-binding protein [Dyella sp. SG609]|uniref:AAA family ATPase n=1 Tax=Dyella sp. SG609 TaxID=2587018 RepID=UPI00144706B7|nr:ATP-binding protein [Dyella sp. SG609]NKJ23821.1 energy-coupling factor transporter ATP-binding protein EcfA2 [Dyella sp. SG609]